MGHFGTGTRRDNVPLTSSRNTSAAIVNHANPFATESYVVGGQKFGKNAFFRRKRRFSHLLARPEVGPLPQERHAAKAGHSGEKQCRPRQAALLRAPRRLGFLRRITR